MNKNRENFIKYSNDLYFHHLLVENERIRTLICQELVSDRKIISIKLKKAIEEYIKYYNEKRINVKRKGLSPLAYDNNPYLKFYSPTISVYYTTIDAFYFIYLSKNQPVHILVTVQEIQLFEVLLEFHQESLHCLHELYDNDILMWHFLVSLNVLFVDLSYNF